MDVVNHNTTISKCIIRGNTNKKQIAFTYDAEGSISGTVEILNILKKHNIKCTFFLTGIWANQFNKLAKRLVLEGHEIGNHSFSHPDMRQLSYDEIIKNIKAGEEVIESITGIKTNLFRIPFGNFNDNILKAIAEAGYETNIYWSIDTEDWILKPIQAVVNNILQKAENGDIVLMHVLGHNTSIITDKAIENLKAQNFSFVTISELLK